jgi:hypothetical protein
VATTRKKKVDLDESIVVLDTHIGEPLVIRANPSDEAVRGFVEEHTRRYVAGEAGGPSGIAAYRIFNAKRFVSEAEWMAGTDAADEIDITDLLPS